MLLVPRIAALVALAPAAPAAAALTISPAAGTPDASPQTQISVLGVAPARIGRISVVGAVSGAHTGGLHAYSGGRGASFVLAQPLTEGERVTATIRIRGRAPIRRTFTVAHLGPAQPLLKIDQTQPDKLEHYVSRPDLTPPHLTVLKRADNLPGSIFLTPLPSPVVHPHSPTPITISPVGPGGPMIADARGRVVWFRQLTPPDVAANLRIQRYRGRRVLTWWQGGVTPSAFGVGTGIVADSSYRTIATVHAGNGYPLDIHELELAGADAFVTVYSPILVHLPGTPAGQESRLMDALVQEIDIPTGLVVWEWHGYGHIPLKDSYATPANSASYDAFHFNSVQALPGGRVLVSARDTSAVYEVDQASGRINWALGGKARSFRLARGARFWFQHDAGELPGDRVRLFDDGAGPPQREPYSRGLILGLDRRHHVARVVRSYHRDNHTSAQSEGSLQHVAGGNVFLGFGSEPFFSEFSAAGRLLFDASLPDGDGSYRVFRFPWKAAPRTLPDAAAQRTDASHVAVYASWNGATAVAHWQVLGGPDAASLRPLATAPRRDFETRIDVTGTDSAFAVRALGADGKVLATSKVAAAP